MNCCVCKGENVTNFSVERIECVHCGGSTEILYMGCDDCGTMWKSVNGEIIECISENIPQEMLDDEAAAIQVMDLEPKNGTMSEMIHKCLRCEAVSHEIGDGYYRCSNCNFEWEVL
jgi:hypothetical protein